LVKAAPGVVRMVLAGGRGIAVAIQAASRAGISNGGNHFALHSTFCGIQPRTTLRIQALTCFEIRGKPAMNTFKCY
jgi:hypothetical protein